jgi:UPF0716 protein FxsA
MHPLKMVAFGLLALPLAEFVAFLLVAGLLGFATALLLLVLVSLGGLLILRQAGGSAITRLRATTGNAKISSVTLDGSGTATALGGILLVIPGFITGLLGALVILPVSRGWLLSAARRWLAGSRSQTGPQVVDLAPDEWEALPGPKLPPRRRRRKTSETGPVSREITDSN